MIIVSIPFILLNLRHEFGTEVFEGFQYALVLIVTAGTLL
jgi:hypothetical protein